eukprot:2788034-Prymnesium_polylepis.1
MQLVIHVERLLQPLACRRRARSNDRWAAARPSKLRRPRKRRYARGHRSAHRQCRAGRRCRCQQCAAYQPGKGLRAVRHRLEWRAQLQGAEACDARDWPEEDRLRRNVALCRLSILHHLWVGTPSSPQATPRSWRFELLALRASTTCFVDWVIWYRPRISCCRRPVPVLTSEISDNQRSQIRRFRLERGRDGLARGV